MFCSMIKKIKSFLNISKHRSESDIYKDRFEEAVRFTSDQHLSLDCDLSMASCNVNERYDSLIEAIAIYLPAAIEVLKSEALSPVDAFGGHCANIHYGIIEFIREKYPHVIANIVVGEVSIDEFAFAFDQTKCKHFLEKGNQSKTSEFHVWINIDSDFIIDCTFGTFINTRLSGACGDSEVLSAFGGVIYGKLGDLKNIKIDDLKHRTPERYVRVIYVPIIVGLESLFALAPKY